MRDFIITLRPFLFSHPGRERPPPRPFGPPLPLLLASTSMADSRQPEDGAPQWDPSGGPEPAGTHGANGYSSSAYRSCQPGAAHVAAASYSARENGFNGELGAAHAVTAGRTPSLLFSIFLPCCRSSEQFCFLRFLYRNLGILSINTIMKVYSHTFMLSSFIVLIP